MDYPQPKELHAFLENLRGNEWVSYVSDNNWIDLYTKFARKRQQFDNSIGGGVQYVNPADFAGLVEWDGDVGSALDYLSSGMASFGYVEMEERSDASWRQKGRLALSKVAFTVMVEFYSCDADMIKSVQVCSCQKGES